MDDKALLIALRALLAFADTDPWLACKARTDLARKLLKEEKCQS